MPPTLPTGSSTRRIAARAIEVRYLSACATQAPRISGIWPPIFAAIAADNKRNAMLSTKTSGIRVMVGLPVSAT